MSSTESGISFSIRTIVRSRYASAFRAIVHREILHRKRGNAPLPTLGWHLSNVPNYVGSLQDLSTVVFLRGHDDSHCETSRRYQHAKSAYEINKRVPRGEGKKGETPRPWWICILHRSTRDRSRDIDSDVSAKWVLLERPTVVLTFLDNLIRVWYYN